jgi:predicted nucleic acid-binding protein
VAATGRPLGSLSAGEERRLGLRSRLRAARLIFYFDTSALVKLVVVEDGSGLAAELWGSAYPAASSIFTYPEARAALAAASRLDRLGADEHRKALADFEGLYADLITVGVDQELAVRAGKYAEDLGLRGYDSVHLATALELGDDEVVVVTWGRDLARATEQVGLGVAGLGGDQA